VLLVVTHAQAANHIVTISGFAFSPNPLSITAGETVTWTNSDPVAHTSTSDTAVWNTGVISPGSSSSAITFSSAGNFPYHCNIHPFMTATVNVVGCTSACGDPHFTGYDGVRYGFQGEPNKTFALISDPSVQINSVFIPGLYDTTMLGNTCVRTCGHTLEVTPQFGVYLDGKVLATGGRFNSSGLVVSRYAREYVEVTIPHRWHMRFNIIPSVFGDHINVDYATPLYTYNNQTHGILGHTMSGKRVPKERCNTSNEGACEVEGAFRDYEVVGDLCSVKWTHSFFDPTNCM